MPQPITQSFVEPQPCNLSKATVQQLAERIADKVGYKPGGDLKAIVQSLGGNIVYESGDYELGSGSLEVHPTGSKKTHSHFIIRVLGVVGNLRNRFTIAHELGHYFLHSGVGTKGIRVARAGTGRVEWEANWFAAAFLMPAAPFRRDWARADNNIYRMVDRYQVSEAAIEIRLEQLGLLVAA